MKKSSRTIYLICVTVLIEVIGFSMIIPILPLMFTEPDSNIFVLSQNSSETFQYIMLGFLFATYTIGQFFSNPIFGQLSDRYGRRLLLGSAIFGTSLSNFVFAFGALIMSLPILIGARLFDGITGGSIAIAQAVGADISTPQERAKNFGLIGASLGIGFMMGPLLGGVLSDPAIVSWFGAPFAFAISGLLSLINVFFIYKFLPETSPLEQNTDMNLFRSIKNIGRAFLNDTTRYIYSLSFLYSFGFTMFTTFFGVYLVQQLGYTQSNIGFFFFYLGLLIVPFQIFLVPFADKNLKQITNLILGFIGLALSLLIIAYTTETILLLLITILFSASNAIARTSITTVVSKKATAKSQGSALGVNASVQSLGQAIPAIIAGLLAAVFGSSSPIIFASVTFALGTTLLIVFRKKITTD